jgi:alpha-N-arabinofuranosidase
MYEPLVKIKTVLFLMMLIYCFNLEYLPAEDNIITVDYGKEIGQIKREVFGNTLLGWDPASFDLGLQHWYGNTDYGTGIWVPDRNQPVNEVIDLAKKAGVSIVRFSTVNHYNWKAAIGKNRKHYLFGIDEFMHTIEEMNAEAVFTISYVASSVQDAADLVEYLNAPCDGKHQWADERAENGHPSQYNVKYFEIGNEVDDPVLKVTPEEYADKYLRYFEAMKKIDQSIKIGVVLGQDYWNRRVLEIIKNKLDFGIIHMYPRPIDSIDGKDLELYSPYEIFKMTLAIPVIYTESNIKHILKLLKEKSGADIPLAVTEYNGGFAQEGLFYRFSLGTALLNAELIRIFMKPDNGILMANYFHFLNDWWGMIKSGDDFMKHDYQRPINYIKRPNYYVYELYHNHFGDVLINADVKGSSYDIKGRQNYVQRILTKIKQGTVISENLLPGKWEIHELEGIDAGEKDGVLEIHFNDPQKFNYFHSVKKTTVEPEKYYRLSGYIKTEGLNDIEGICLEIQDGRGWDKTHSVVDTDKIIGTTDWQYVDSIYKSLPDAVSVGVMVRREGDKGPLHGNVFIKDVKLEKYIPDTLVPYLSVNASKSEDDGKMYLMVINKNMHEPITSFIKINGFQPSDRADAWILNGPSIYSTNEKKTDNVKVTYKKVEIKNNPFAFTFEPHSFTAVEIKKE